MKICIVAQTFAPQEEGGAEISSRHAANNLSARHEVVVLALGHPGATGAEPGEHPSGGAYRLVRVPFRNSYLPGAGRPSVPVATKALWHLRSAWGAVDAEDLRRFFQTERFDLIYAQNAARLQPALYDVAAELGIPVCQHLRDYALLCPRTSMFRQGRNCENPCAGCRVLTARARGATKSVKTVIAVSEFVKQRFRRHGVFPDADWHVLHNTNTARADFDAALLARRPEPEPVFTIGYLGALSHEKGVEHLLRAFLGLPSDLPARLLIAGRGRPDVVEGFKALAAPAGDRVEWLGHVRPETVYARSEIIVVPSIWHEPQARVLIEAATYGIPVIAARTGGSPEVAEGHGVGWVYDAESVDPLRELMARSASQRPFGWRESLPKALPGLSAFKGTAEDTHYYERLERLLIGTLKRTQP